MRIKITQFPDLLRLNFLCFQVEYGRIIEEVLF